MKRVGLYLHGDREAALTTASWLADQLTARGVEVEAGVSDAARIASPRVTASTAFPEGVELIIVLGGDGTLLRAAQAAGPAGIPLLGVNLGRLGFLSELERSELGDGLRRILEEGFAVEERMILQGDVIDGASRTEIRALNDVIVEKVEIGRAIKLAVSIGGEPFIEIAADGLIMSTPTGSTAYSFSAGGPVVSPRLDCLIVTPVAPHGLFDRSLVVPPDEMVVVRVLPDPDAASLSVDGGPAQPARAGTELHVRGSSERIRLAKLDPAPFWRLVREKFGLRSEDA